MEIIKEIEEFLKKNGYKIKRITTEANKGEIVIDRLNGELFVYPLKKDRKGGMPILVLESSFPMKITFDFDCLRHPKAGEYYLDELGRICRASVDFKIEEFPIYKRSEE